SPSDSDWCSTVISRDDAASIVNIAAQRCFAVDLRPLSSVLGAYLTARQRCWRYDWVVDIDIKGFSDNIDWMCFSGRSASIRIGRLDDGTLVPRMQGTSQPGANSPLLVMFLHYASTPGWDGGSPA